jgi:hypothetical protein
MRIVLADRAADRIFGGFYVQLKYGNFAAASIEGAADFLRACGAHGTDTRAQA